MIPDADKAPLGDWPPLHETALRNLPSEARCRHCGYQLRGLTETRCPECGTQFDPLDSGWLVRMDMPWTGGHY